YCEFSVTFDNCKAWLQEHHEELYQTLHSTNDSALVSESSGAQSSAKKAALKAEKKLNAETELKKKTKVMIKSEKRKGKKSVTIISHLDIFGIDLKKSSKMFAQKFASGCSISKNAEGKEEIVLQGDIVGNVAKFILESFPSISEDKLQLL
ncbi:Translation machinery-associated protein 22, partial [Coelomomyces lativittatus]